MNLIYKYKILRDQIQVAIVAVQFLVGFLYQMWLLQLNGDLDSAFHNSKEMIKSI